MADFSTLKTEIAAAIKDNGAQAITGNVLQARLLAIVDELNSAKVDAASGKGLSTNDLTDALAALINSAVQPAAMTAAIADAVAGYVAKSQIRTATGTSDSDVMSQKAVSTAVSSLQSSDDTAAEGIDGLAARVASLEKRFAELVTGEATVESLTLRNLDLYGTTSLVRVGTGAPDVAPDFAGQLWLDKAAPHVYIGRGADSVSNWWLIA